MAGTLEYATALFDAETVERLAGHYVRLLEEIVARPEARLSQLNLLGEAEKRKLLEEWNGAEMELPERNVHALIEAQAEATPEAVAVAFGESRLTYRELEERANRLANHLRKLGVGPEARVGVCLERSLELVVGLLGTMKAGGAYVPLDPGYPAERLGWMVEDAKPAVVLTVEGLRGRLGKHEGQVVCLDSGWEEVAKQPAARPVSVTTGRTWRTSSSRRAPPEGRRGR